MNRRLSTVRNLPTQYLHANFTQSSIRWLLFNSKENGFSSCVVRVGRRVLIDLDLFESWLDNQSQGRASA